MPKYIIITEKPSARKNFEKALGGLTGHLANYDYELTNLRGHVMTLKEPQEQVPSHLKEKYESWQLKDLPWDLKDITWKHTYLKSWNPRSKKMESTKRLVDDLKKKAATADALVIATDTDPSGEGDLLAWEAIDAIQWTGPVYRANFADESPKSLLKALNNLRAIEGKDHHGAYQKGLTRNKWNGFFLSDHTQKINQTKAASRASQEWLDETPTREMITLSQKAFINHRRVILQENETSANQEVPKITIGKLSAFDGRGLWMENNYYPYELIRHLEIQDEYRNNQK